MEEKKILPNFIVLEGIDGAGTTTQLNNLEGALKEKGIPHYPTFEPTDGITGRTLRTILKGDHPVLPKTIAYLFAADRNEHLYSENGVAAKAKDHVVICDRYLFSSMAYQSIQCGFDLVNSLNAPFPLPEHLFFLEVPVAVGQERLKGRENREIYETNHFQEKVRDSYHKVLDYFEGSAMQIHRIDGTLPPEEITKKIRKIIETLPIIKG